MEGIHQVSKPCLSFPETIQHVKIDTNYICVVSVRKHGLDDVPHEVADLLSHATQERLRNILERLALISEHRLEIYKVRWSQRGSVFISSETSLDTEQLKYCFASDINILTVGDKSFMYLCFLWCAGPNYSGLTGSV